MRFRHRHGKIQRHLQIKTQKPNPPKIYSKRVYDGWLDYMMTAYHRQLWADDPVIRINKMSPSSDVTLKKNQLNQSKQNAISSEIAYDTSLCFFFFFFYHLLKWWLYIRSFFYLNPNNFIENTLSSYSEKRNCKMLKCKHLKIIFSQIYRLHNLFLFAINILTFSSN